MVDWEEGAAELEGALCKILERLADPHADPVEGSSQGDENQEQQHGPRGVDPRVRLSLHPRSSLSRYKEVLEINVSRKVFKLISEFNVIIFNLTELPVITFISRKIY